MKLSHLSETLIGSEIVKLGGEIRENIRQVNIFTFLSSGISVHRYFHHPCKFKVSF
jgi:hypothetical protein